MHKVEPSETISVLGNGAFIRVNPYVCELPSERSKHSEDQENEDNSFMEMMGIMQDDSSVDRSKAIERVWLSNCGFVLTTLSVVATTFVVVYLVVLK
mmetsp:Transcript_27887/g.41159  ORF Transcript_27887/g.41159 Transcript_27887/m.41159 type:complete len:97 (+) Transcript_27887:69-359(+)